MPRLYRGIFVSLLLKGLELGFKFKLLKSMIKILKLAFANAK